MQWQKNLWVLSAGAFINNIAFQATLPFYPTLLIAMGMTDNISLWSGIIISVNFMAAGLISPVWGSLADRYGKRIMLARSGFGMTVTTALIALAVSPWQLLVFRLFNGVLAGFLPASIMLVVSMTPQANMGYALGKINTFIAIGSILGPFLGGTMVDLLGIRQAFLASAGVLLIGTFLSYFGTKEKVIKQTKKTTIIDDLGLVLKNRTLWVYFLAITTLQATNFMIMPILPLRIAEIVSVNSGLLSGILFSVVGVSMAIGSSQLFRLKRFSNGTILLTSLSLCGLFCVGQGLTGSILFLGILRFFFGFCYAGVNVTANVLITQNSAEEIRGRVFGVLNSFIYFGSVIGPLLGGFLGERFGYVSAFYGCAVIFFAAALIIWRHHRTLPPPEQQIAG